MFINENKRKGLHNRVKFPEDLVGAPTWLPFLCLGLQHGGRDIMCKSRIPFQRFGGLSLKFNVKRTSKVLFKVKRWRSGESTHFPPMWPGFDSQTRRHMWVEFVNHVLFFEVFLRVLRFISPALLKIQYLT